jgi:hypothetical protein
MFPFACRSADVDFAESAYLQRLGNRSLAIACPALGEIRELHVTPPRSGRCTFWVQLGRHLHRHNATLASQWPIKPQCHETPPPRIAIQEVGLVARRGATVLGRTAPTRHAYSWK